jgi:hypothetical protein
MFQVDFTISLRCVKDLASSVNVVKYIIGCRMDFGFQGGQVTWKIFQNTQILFRLNPVYNVVPPSVIHYYVFA